MLHASAWRAQSGYLPQPMLDSCSDLADFTSRKQAAADLVPQAELAGDPITGLKWSRRTTDKIAMALGDFGAIVSPNTVARLRHQMGYSRRVNPTKISPRIAVSF